MELLITFLIFALVLVAVLYVIRLVPDPTLQAVLRVIAVVCALVWLITHVRSLVHGLVG